jgi:hypothetical protein
MDYKDWYKTGVELGYLRAYTTRLIDGLMSNVDKLEGAFTKSVQEKLGKSKIDKMESMGKLKYWIMVQRDMMDNDQYWKETDDV